MTHFALSFQALASGVGSEAEPSRLPELTWSCESRENSATAVHGTKYQKEEIHGENRRDLQKFSLE